MNSAQRTPPRTALPPVPGEPRDSFERLRQQAITLRRAGRSRREIKDLLGIGSNETLNEALRGEPPPEWTRRPRAKDDLRQKARSMREAGLKYSEIAAALGVSKSSVSLWVRDLPHPQPLGYEETRRRCAEGVRRYWATERPAREARRESFRAAAAAEIGPLSEREVLIAGAVAYWCEGGKNKPHRRYDQVCFINSDPGLISLFLEFLDSVGVVRERVSYRLYIHENADVASAEQFWQQVVQSGQEQFRRTVLKTHQSKTVRTTVGDEYRGCLRVNVSRSAELYRRIEGWADAVLGRPALSPTPETGQVSN